MGSQVYIKIQQEPPLRLTKQRRLPLEEVMPSSKIPSRKKPKSGSQKKKVRGTGSRRSLKVNTDAIDALIERLDMMLPEMMSRIAAVEHVLVEKGACSHTDLRRARKFIDEQESW